jgi:FkbM family methyltransferase
MAGKSSESWDSTLFATEASQDQAEFTRYQTPFGEFWGSPGESAAIGTVIIEELCGIYEDGPARIDSGDVVVDLGAHIGTFTRIALNRGASRVVAFEANPRNASSFKKNFEREIKTGRVSLIEAPIWSETKTVMFEGTSLVGMVGESGTPMEAKTLDGVAQELGLERINFIKSDVEGAERHALLGASNTLASRPKLAISSYHYPDDPDVLSKIVKEHGYTPWFDAGQKRMFAA